jgi:hypothetical protein
VTYTVMGIMCSVVAKRMSSDILFLIKQLAFVLLMSIYCLIKNIFSSEDDVYAETQDVIDKSPQVMCHNFLRYVHSDV